MSYKIFATVACLLLIAAASIAFFGGNDNQTPTAAAQTELSQFSSYQELKDFVGNSTPSYPQNKGGWAMPFAPSAVAELDGAARGASGPEYSGTNIQVQGVDEADIVKTDGEFIYVVSGSRLVIVKAYPAEEAQIVSEIKLENGPIGLFINGDKLVVLYQNWDGVLVMRGVMDFAAPSVIMPVEMPVPQTTIEVYDVSDRESPALTRNVTVDGQYFGSRMVGEYVYAVICENVFDYQGQINLPRIDDSGAGAREIAAQDIYHGNVTDDWYAYTTVLAVNTQNDDEEPAHESVLVGASSNIYVSLNNIYITSTKWSYEDQSETTSIHRIAFEGGKIEPQSSGEVPGSVLDQFSMDEHDGFFRVATTLTKMTGVPRETFAGQDATFRAEEPATENNLYVLDMNLDIVSSLEGLAPGESIYSARFMGDRCYLVTFQKIDPFFVIDLQDPYAPEVLGELKITGYSDYLHPYDENHVIGIGKETIGADQGDFAWYQGVKISLFDVSDVENPVEIAKYEIGDRGTDSPVLSDHKALLFDREKNLLVLPVLVAEVKATPYPDGFPAYGEYVYQGAYVFDISVEGGLNLRGTISHYDVGDRNDTGYYFGYDYSVQRSLYIGDVLYTISNAKIKMNSLDNLDEIGEVELMPAGSSNYKVEPPVRFEGGGVSVGSAG